MDLRVRAIVSLLLLCTPSLPLTLFTAELPIKDIVDIGALITSSNRVISKRRHIHVAKYQDYDLDRTIQFLGDLTRGLQGSGLPRKSDTIRTPVAASIEHSVEPPQTSVTLPPAAGLDSSPQVTDDDPESILDNMSDCENQTSIYP